MSLSPAERDEILEKLKRLTEYMPSYYISFPEFENCIDALSKKDMNSAVTDLIALAGRSGHYFSEEYWNTLGETASAKNMISETSFCAEQINRNKRELRSKIPFGWTMEKIDDSHYRNHVSEKLREEWACSRRQKDQVVELISKDGIHLKPDGRCGYIYFVHGGRLAEFATEVGMKGQIVYFSSSHYWILPDRQLISDEERSFMRREFTEWSKKTGTPVELD